MTLRNGSNRRHIVTMPTTAKPVPTLSEKDKARFWAKVEKGNAGECWPWTGHRDKGGYGRFSIGRGNDLAHRVALAISGTAMPPGMCACHSCDNRGCCNPSHLFIGSDADNTADMISKGRAGYAVGDLNGSRKSPHLLKRGNEHPSRLHPECLRRGDNHPSRLKPEYLLRGDQHPCSKLTGDRVRALRALHSEGKTGAYLASFFGISRGTVSQITTGKTWRHMM